MENIEILSTVAVEESQTARFESFLNSFGISLGNWDCTRALNVNGRRMVVYAVLCQKGTLDAILRCMQQN